MNEGTKVGRQGKGAKKARFTLKLTTENYDFLVRRSRQEDKSMAAFLNDLLRRVRGQSSMGS